MSLVKNVLLYGEMEITKYLLKISVFWDVASCILIDNYLRLLSSDT